MSSTLGKGRKEGRKAIPKSIFLSSYTCFKCFGDTASSHERRTWLFGSSGIISPCHDWDIILLWRAMISSSVPIDVIGITTNSPRGYWSTARTHNYQMVPMEGPEPPLGQPRWCSFFTNHSKSEQCSPTQQPLPSTFLLTFVSLIKMMREGEWVDRHSSPIFSPHQMMMMMMRECDDKTT